MFHLTSRIFVKARYLAGLLVGACLFAQTAVQSAVPDRSEGRVIEAAIENGRFVQADTMLATWKARTQPSMDIEAQILTAELKLSRDRDLNTLPVFLGLIEIEAFACRANEAAGTIYVQEGEWSQAVRHLANVTTQCPERWKAWNMMAVALSGLQKWQASHYAFDQALDLSERRASVLNNFGQSLLLQGDYPNSRKYFAAALDKTPENERYQNNHDIASARMGIRPKRSSSDSTERWSQRLNNAGRAASLAGYLGLGREMLVESLLDSANMMPQTLVNLENNAKRDAN